jgi:hypothetical protein
LRLFVNLKAWNKGTGQGASQRVALYELIFFLLYAFYDWRGKSRRLQGSPRKNIMHHQYVIKTHLPCTKGRYYTCFRYIIIFVLDIYIELKRWWILTEILALIRSWISCLMSDMHTHIHRLCDIDSSASLIAHHNYNYRIGVYLHIHVVCRVYYTSRFIVILFICLLSDVYFKNMLKKCNIIITRME